MRESLIRFVEREIIPRYDDFDKGHQRDHVLAVIEQGQYLAGFYDVDREVIYAACACHDLGIRDGREFHHLASGKIIREELDLSPWFSSEPSSATRHGCVRSSTGFTLRCDCNRQSHRNFSSFINLWITNI